MINKLLHFLLIVALLSSCVSKEENKSYPFYLGTYTDGESKGIYQGVLKNDGTFDTLQLAAEANNPSFLCFANQGTSLLSVGEVNIEGTGTVDSYQITGNGLKHASTSISGGAHPCHIMSNDKGDVLMANYTGGNLGYVQIDNDGNLSDLLDVAQHNNSSNPEQQNKAHAHSAWMLGEDKLVAVDLGINQLIFYLVKNNELHKTDSLLMEQGAGPRHLTFHPTKEIMYVVNELNSTVSVVIKDNKGWKLLNSVTTLPMNYSDESYCADIHISNDGRFLYASNRGHNSIAIFQLDDTGQALKLISHQDVKGEWPRNFSLTPDGEYLVVANQHSNNLVAFKRSDQTGQLSFSSEIKAGSPVCMLFK